jgi:hypothetical protein
VPETAAVREESTEPELSEEQLAAAKLVGYYPTFKEGAAGQLFELLFLKNILHWKNCC